MEIVKAQCFASLLMHQCLPQIFSVVFFNSLLSPGAKNNKLDYQEVP